MNEELTWRGKLGFGGACVVCCAVPMLVLTGVLSAGAALVGGIAAGSVILVGLVTGLIFRHRGSPRLDGRRGRDAPCHPSRAGCCGRRPRIVQPDGDDGIRLGGVVQEWRTVR